jgi:hypothetical protein
MVYVYEQQRWEYKVPAKRADEPAPSQAELNELGEAGWELLDVSVVKLINLYIGKPAQPRYDLSAGR